MARAARRARRTGRAARSDRADQTGVLRGQLTDDEEGGPDLGGGEGVEQPARRDRHPFLVMPSEGRPHLQARGDLDTVVFFDIESQDDLH